MLIDFFSGWYLMYTKANHENKVYRELAKKGYTLFLPTTKVLKQWHDRRKTIDQPLFPSYIFIHLASMEQYYLAAGHNSVIYFVKSGNKIARIRHEVIDRLKMVLDQGSDFCVLKDDFACGEMLEICDGPLAGMMCEFVNYRNRQMVIVRVNILNRMLLSHLPVETLSRSKNSRFNYG